MAPMFSKLSKIISINGVSVASVIIMFYFMRSYRKAHQLEHERMLHRKKSSKSSSKKQEVYVNKTFIKQLVKLLKILVPSLVSAEMGYVLLVGCSLVARSFCDILMINNATLIESAIIGKQLKTFVRYLVVYAWTMPVISGVNNLLKLGINELKLRFRLQLTSYLYKLYMSDFIYYKMNNLDSRVCNPDQLLTQDVEKFCNSVTDVYSNICKPVFDIFLYIYKLSTAIGVQAPLYMILYMFLSGAFLTFLRRPIGYMTMQEQKLEGEFRYVNSRLITHCEEVAFYRGDRREQLCVNSSFNDLFNHLKYFLEFKFSVGFIDNIIAKYLATMVGFLVLSQPFLSQFHSTHHKSYQGRIEEYGQSGKMLLKLSDAIGRLVLATREMTRLAGFTNRVSEFIEVLKQVKAGKYEKNCIQNIKTCGCLVLKDNVIEFDKVPLVTPNGDILIKELNFRVQSGMNVLICGPNGCGKSSMFRILGELWPISGGTVIKPAQEKLFYIPQKPYMAIGTLRDQIIYPDVYQDMIVKGFTDSDLLKFLEIVQLTYILEREGGWSVEADWLDVLSGGEKQRIAMARLFYHQPQFAILDECTSAVSVDVEDCMYQYCKKAGITLFTVSHRKSLWKHHEFILQMDGQGSYKFQKIELDTPVFGS